MAVQQTLLCNGWQCAKMIMATDAQTLNYRIRLSAECGFLAVGKCDERLSAGAYILINMKSSENPYKYKQTSLAQ